MNNTLAIELLKDSLHELKKERAFLLPLRLFMGLGWLRTGAEKLLEPEWWSGGLLANKLSHQLAAGEVYFPFYEALLTNVFVPNAAMMSWIILIGEFLVGFGILFGTLTNGALLGALFMNLNFVLAGWVNPSAFYIIIQVLLLFGGAGQILGGDQILGRYVKSAWLVSKRTMRMALSARRITAAAVFALFLSSLLSLLYVRDFTPSGSVEDPAMLISIMCAMTGVSLIVALIRSLPVGTIERLDLPILAFQKKVSGSLGFGD